MKDNKQIIPRQVVVFRLDDMMFALPMDIVIRIINSVFITPLPNAPPVILGIINMEGRILPVFDIRKRFGLPPREIIPDDRYIILQTRERTVAIVADEVDGVSGLESKNVISDDELIRKSEYIAGIVKTDSGMILIHDPDRFLSDQENRLLSEAIRTGNISEYK